MKKSKGIERLEEQQAQMEPGSLRYEALDAAKRFKCSWIDLGRILWTVFKDKKFREWGYLSFDAYCSKEVGIRSTTAKKLLNSYYFLEKEEPDTLKQLSEESPAKLPAMESVNSLRLLANKEAVPKDRYQQVRHQVLEKGAEPPQVRREIRMLQEALKPKQPEEARSDRRERVIRRSVGTLKAMRMELETDHLIPQRLAEQIGTLAQKLEEVLAKN
jgi:hypothetical protein